MQSFIDIDVNILDKLNKTSMQSKVSATEKQPSKSFCGCMMWRLYSQCTSEVEMKPPGREEIEEVTVETVILLILMTVMNCLVSVSEERNKRCRNGTSANLNRLQVSTEGRVWRKTCTYMATISTNIEETHFHF